MAAALTADESLKQFPLRFTDVKTQSRGGRGGRLRTTHCHIRIVKPKVKLSGRMKENLYHDLLTVFSQYDNLILISLV